MRRLKIYLAGKMSGLSHNEMNTWRVKVKNQLLHKTGFGSQLSLQIVNPVDYYSFEEKIHQSEIEVEDYDLAHVKSSDIIIVNLEGLSSSDGTKIELHDAKYNNKIPVIAFGDIQLYESLHPWIKNSITRVEPNIESVCEYISDFYMM